MKKTQNTGMALVENQAGKMEFSFNETINLPRNITHHQFGNKHLFIAPEKGIWLTTDDKGAEHFKSFKQGKTINIIIKETMDREKVSKDKAIKGIRSLLRQIAFKNFYEDIVPKTPDPSDFNLHLHLTQKCNLRCKHCYMDSGVSSPNELVLTEWKDIIDQFVGLGGNSVTFSGGEPLMFDGFCELADYVHRKGLDTMLITNGTLIQDDAIAKSLSKCVNKVRLSVDGATAEGHECIRGRGTFDKVNKAIEMLAKTDIKLELAITVFPENIADIVQNLRSYLIHLRNQGVRLDNVGIARGMQEGRAGNCINGLYFESKYRKIKRQISGEIWDLDYFKPIKAVECGYGIGLAVTSGGDIHPCGSFLLTRWNIRKHRLEDAYSMFMKNRQRASVDNIPFCQNCDLRYICGGGCRILNLKYNGDICRPLCSNDKRMKLYLTLIGRDEVFFNLAQKLDGQQMP